MSPSEIEIASPEAVVPAILWHYTTADALLKIS